MGSAAVFVKAAGNQSEYAKHREERGLRGQSAVAVHKAIKSGRLRRAIRDDGLIDFAIADEEWAQTTTPVIEPARPAQPQVAAGTPGNVVDGDHFAAVRLRREKAEAELAELKAGKQRGDLVETVEARRTWHAIGRMFSAARERIPASIAPKLIGKTDLAEIEQILKAALRDADARVADEIQSRYSEIIGTSHGDGNGSTDR